MRKIREERNKYNRDYYKNNKDKRYLSHRLWVKNNLDKVKAYTDKYRKRNQDFANRVKLKFGCKFCGYKEHAQALHFDHINRNEKYQNISFLVKNSFHNIIKIKEEMRKCQILCANCHAVKSYKDKDYKKIN